LQNFHEPYKGWAVWIHVSPLTLENRYRVKIHAHSPSFQGQLIEKKIRSITFIVWVPNARKGYKNAEKCFKDKYQSLRHVSTSIFQVLFKNIVFRSVALTTKIVMGYFRFFKHRLDILPPCTQPYLSIKCNFEVIVSIIFFHFWLVITVENINKIMISVHNYYIFIISIFELKSLLLSFPRLRNFLKEFSGKK